MLISTLLSALLYDILSMEKFNIPCSWSQFLFSWWRPMHRLECAPKWILATLLKCVPEDVALHAFECTSDWLITLPMNNNVCVKAAICKKWNWSISQKVFFDFDLRKWEGKDWRLISLRHFKWPKSCRLSSRTCFVPTGHQSVFVFHTDKWRTSEKQHFQKYLFLVYSNLYFSLFCNSSPHVHRITKFTFVIDKPTVIWTGMRHTQI